MSAGVVLVPGTWSWGSVNGAAKWYRAGSPFVQFLEDHEIEVLSKDRPFVWSTDLNGVFWKPRKHTDWEAGGQALSYYLDPAFPHIGLSLEPEQRRLITHSHGLQVALYAAASGCEIDTLVSVTGPIRDDMRMVAYHARPKIKCWIHVYTDWTDKTQVWGSLFDGMLRIERRAIWYDPQTKRPMVYADESLGIPGVGHSGLFLNPDHFPHWVIHGLIFMLHRSACCLTPQIGTDDKETQT